MGIDKVRVEADRIIQAGGFVSVNTGGAPDGSAVSSYAPNPRASPNRLARVNDDTNAAVRSTSQRSSGARMAPTVQPRGSASAAGATMAVQAHRASRDVVSAG